ncbi:MAG: NUDIX hydrolase [bacterium]
MPVLHEGKYLRVISKDGWEYVERTHCNEAVVVLAVTDEGKVILTEQYRVPVGKNVVEFPAGLLKDPGAPAGETNEEAALRELLEETGYQAEEAELLAGGPPTAGLSSEIALFYEAGSVKKVSKGGGVESEKITVHEIPLQEVDGWLQGMEAKGKLVDPKVYAGLYLLGKRGI